MLDREIEIIETMKQSHENILKYHDYFIKDDYYYIITENCDVLLPLLNSES